MLEAQHLNTGYGRVQVLWDVDLSVGDNEIVALVGPNGAGKTTLLRALSGMTEIRSGTAKFRGQSLQGRSIEQIVNLGISHVPEGRRLFSGLTVRDNLRLGGWRTRNTDIDRVVELFPRLGERLSQITGTMSGGEQQMCAPARHRLVRHLDPVGRSGRRRRSDGRRTGVRPGDRPRRAVRQGVRLAC